MAYLLALFFMVFKWFFRYTLGVPRFMVPDSRSPLVDIPIRILDFA